MVRPTQDCCKYRGFKELKQITTWVFSAAARAKLLQISWIQRTKANHNHIEQIH